MYINAYICICICIEATTRLGEQGILKSGAAIQASTPRQKGAHHAAHSPAIGLPVHGQQHNEGYSPEGPSSAEHRPLCEPCVPKASASNLHKGQGHY